MKHIVLASGLLVRDNTLLLVLCRYDGEAEPLWTLPGGRPEPGEPLAHALRREFREETGLHVDSSGVAYVSDSVDERAGLAVVNCTFWVKEADPHQAPVPSDSAVLRADFVPLADAAALLQADVLRVPVTAALREPSQAHYFSFDSQAVDVAFFGRTNRSAQHG
jgi:ADP-ribose pyrophosphatase YjhB (NUDIX family)